MSRTHKNEPYKYYSKEKKPARKSTNRKARKKDRLQVQNEEYEFEPRKGTQGWLTH